MAPYSQEFKEPGLAWVLIVLSICRVVWEKKGEKRLPQTPDPSPLLEKQRRGLGTSTFKLVICTWGKEYADEGIRKMLGGKGS